MALTFLEWVGSLHFRDALVCGPYLLGIKALFFHFTHMILGWYSWSRNLSKDQTFLHFRGNISEKFPPKAEELFYFVKMPPLKLQPTQPCLTENHKKEIKGEISEVITTNGTHSTLFSIPCKTSDGFDFI